MPANDVLKAGITRAFLIAAKAVERRLRSAGLAQTAQVARSVVTPGKTVGEWSISTSMQSVNVLRIQQVATQIAPWLSAAELAEFDRCAMQLAESAAEVCPSGRSFPVAHSPCSRPRRT